MNLILLSFFLACGAEDKDTAVEDSVDSGASETSSEPAAEPAAEPSSEPVGNPSVGQQIVESKCLGCHSSSPDLANSGEMTDEEIVLP